MRRKHDSHIGIDKDVSIEAIKDKKFSTLRLTSFSSFNLINY